MDDGWVLLEIGCAECGDWPLVAPKGRYATAAEAAQTVPESAWKEHPQGGFISQWGSGAFWIAPLAALSIVSDYEPVLEITESPREYVTP